MKLAEYQNLKAASEEKKEAAHRARGAYDAALGRLKEDWGCATLKEARAKLAELQERETKLGKKLEAKLEEFTDKWKQSL